MLHILYTLLLLLINCMHIPTYTGMHEVLYLQNHLLASELNYHFSYIHTYLNYIPLSSLPPSSLFPLLLSHPSPSLPPLSFSPPSLFSLSSLSFSPPLSPQTTTPLHTQSLPIGVVSVITN